MRGKRCFKCGGKHRAKGLCAYHYFQDYQQRPEVKARLKKYRKRCAVQRKTERGNTARPEIAEKRGLFQNLKGVFRGYLQKIKTRF